MVLQMHIKQKTKHLENTEVKHKLAVSTFYAISERLLNKANSDQEKVLKNFMSALCHSYSEKH